MKLLKTLLLPLPLLLVVLAFSTALAGQKEDDATIHQRHEEWIAAWNKHDPKIMASFWTADGDLINPFGRHAQGTAAIEKLFTEEQSGPMAASTYAGTIENIRHLGNNVAIVDVNGAITGMKTPDGTPAPPFKHHVTWIAEKKAGKWMAVSARAFISLPTPTPAQ